MRCAGAGAGADVAVGGAAGVCSLAEAGAVPQQLDGIPVAHDLEAGSRAGVKLISSNYSVSSLGYILVPKLKKKEERDWLIPNVRNDIAAANSHAGWWTGENLLPRRNRMRAIIFFSLLSPSKNAYKFPLAR